MVLRKPRIGIIALGRSTFDVAFAEEVLAQAGNRLQTMDADFVGTPELLFDAQAVEAVIPLLQGGIARFCCCFR